MITGLPAAMPFTVPEVDTVANVASLLLHVPPVLVSVNTVAKPAHTFAVPPIEAGNGLTVIAVEIIQPVVSA